MVVEFSVPTSLPFGYAVERSPVVLGRADGNGRADDHLEQTVAVEVSHARAGWHPLAKTGYCTANSRSDGPPDYGL